jgi:hypothetical protein
MTRRPQSRRSRRKSKVPHTVSLAQPPFGAAFSFFRTALRSAPANSSSTIASRSRSSAVPGCRASRRYQYPAFAASPRADGDRRGPRLRAGFPHPAPPRGHGPGHRVRPTRAQPATVRAPRVVYRGAVIRKNALSSPLVDATKSLGCARIVRGASNPTDCVALCGMIALGVPQRACA